MNVLWKAINANKFFVKDNRMTESNPYATPNSEIRNIDIRSGRPGWVWVILISYVFSVIMTLVSIGLLLAGKIPIPIESKQYLDHLTIADYGASLLTMCLNLTAAVLLFRLRRISLHFFMIALSISVIYTIWRAITTGWLDLAGGSGATGVLFGYGLKVVVCFYVWRLKNDGVLN